MVELLTRQTFEELLKPAIYPEGEVGLRSSAYLKEINQILEAAEKEARQEFLSKLPGHNGALLRAIEKRNSENRKINPKAEDLLGSNFRYNQAAAEKALNKYRSLNQPAVIENIAVKKELQVASERLERSGIFISPVGDLLNLEKREIISEVLTPEKTFSELRAELASRGTLELKTEEKVIASPVVTKERGGFFAAVKRGWNSLFRRNSPTLA